MVKVKVKAKAVPTIVTSTSGTETIELEEKEFKFIAKAEWYHDKAQRMLAQKVLAARESKAKADGKDCDCNAPDGKKDALK